MGEIDRTTTSWVGKDKVLVQAADTGIRSDYYIIDLKEDIVMKQPGILWNHGLFGTTVVLDTVVYAIGSREEYDGCPKYIPKSVDINPDVEHIHSRTSVMKLTENKWKAGKDTIYDRWCPDCATLGNKIYAFGCSHLGEPMAEVYDTEIGEWEVIHPPPNTDDEDWDLDSWTLAAPVLSDPKNNRLLVHFGVVGSLYAYYPDNSNNNKWECLGRNIRRFGYPSALIDEVIYSFRPLTVSAFIVAYDIPSKTWLKVLFPSSFRNLYSSMHFSSMEHMFHLGDGMLCLAGSYPLFNGTLLEFVRFSVERIDPGQVRVTPASVHSLPVKDCSSAACVVPL